MIDWNVTLISIEEMQHNPNYLQNSCRQRQSATADCQNEARFETWHIAAKVEKDMGRQYVSAWQDKLCQNWSCLLSPPISEGIGTM